MATIDFHGAYRDATRGMTIKALQERMQQAQEEQALAMRPRTIAHPLQGVAQVLDVVGAGIREGRAANAEMEGRKRFAELLAGGLTQDEMGEAIGLDPDTALKYQQHTWDTEKEAAAAAARQAELQQGHQWDVEAADTRTQAEKDAQAALFGHQDAAAVEAARVAEEKAQADQARKQQEGRIIVVTGDEAAKRNLDPNRRYEVNAFTGDTTDITPEPIKPLDQWGPVTPEIAAKYGPDSDVAKNPGLYHYNTGTGDIERIDANAYGNMSPAAKEFDIQSAKDNQDWVATGRAQAVSNDMQLDKALSDLDQYSKATGGEITGDSSVSSVISGITGLGAPSGITTSLLPDAVNRLFASGVEGAPDPVTLRENVRTVAQQSLKAVLGTQFAAIEGEGVMNRAYDPGAQPAENARRIRLLKIKLQQVAKYNDMRAEWLSNHPSMQGFTGPTPAQVQADFVAYTNSPEFTGGGGGDTAPATDATAPAPAPTTALEAPAVGTVKGGYVFMGGDPSKQENWKKQ